jgi:hypothetical protein
MKLKQLIAGGTIAGALGAAALGMGAGSAFAAPGPPPPAPGGNHGGPAPGNFHAPTDPNDPGGPGSPGGPDHQGGRGGPDGPGGPPPGHVGPGGPPADHPGGPGPDHPGGPGEPGSPWRGDPQRGYFHGNPWGDGPAPWGYGAPPRPAWDRPLPPPGGQWGYGPISYYGHDETPVWDHGFNQWGFWFFGVWIPL